MTPNDVPDRLGAVLDRIGSRDRRVLIAALERQWLESTDEHLRPIWHALMIELRHRQDREDQLLHDLEADERAELDERFPNPEPPAGGTGWWPQGGDQGGD